MNRALTTLILCLATTACESMPGLGEDARVGLEGQYHMRKLTGASQMQYVNNGIKNGSPVTVEEFGFSDREDDYGGQLSYGDGFSGIEVRFLQLDMQTSTRGMSTSAWGALPDGAVTNASFFMDEWKINYFGQLYEYEFENEAKFRFALGGTLAHRDAMFRVDEVDVANGQDLNMKDQGVPYIGARIRGEFRGVSLQAQYDWNGRITFGGDFQGDLTDAEIRLAYAIEDQDLSLFVAHTWSDLPASGNEQGLRYDAEFSLDGFIVGARFEF